MGVQAQNQSENNSKCKQNMERTGSEPFVFGKDALWEDLGGGVKRISVAPVMLASVESLSHVRSQRIERHVVRLDFSGRRHPRESR